MANAKELPLPVINDGFGPQLTGSMTMAQLFDGKTSLHLTETQQHTQAVRDNIPDKLKKELLAFKTKVTCETPRYKFDMLMRWLVAGAKDGGYGNGNANQNQGTQERAKG